MKYLKALFTLTMILAFALVGLGSASATLTLDEWCDFCIDHCDSGDCCDICGRSSGTLTYSDRDYEYVVGTDPKVGTHDHDYSYRNLKERLHKPYTWVAIPTGDCGYAFAGCETSVGVASVDFKSYEEKQNPEHVQRISIQLPSEGDFDAYNQPISGYGMDDRPIDMSGRELRTAPEVNKIYYGEDMKSNFFTKTWLVILYLLIAFIILILIVFAIFRLLLRA